MMEKLVSRILCISFLAAMVFMPRAHAQDLPNAYGLMTDILALEVEANAKLAEPASEGDPEAAAEAKRRADAINASVNDAQQALSNVEAALATGDAAATQAAFEALNSAFESAVNSLTGVIPEVVAEKVAENQKKRGGSGDPDNPPNIHDVPWKSEGIRSYYETLFGQFWNASAFGHGQGFGDQDATPE